MSCAVEHSNSFSNSEHSLHHDHVHDIEAEVIIILTMKTISLTKIVCDGKTLYTSISIILIY